MRAGKGQPPGARAKAEGSEWHPNSHTKPPPGGTERSEPCRGPGHIPLQGNRSLQSVPFGAERPCWALSARQNARTGSTGPPAQSLVGLYLGDVGNPACKAILRDGAVGAVGRAGARAWRVYYTPRRDTMGEAAVTWACSEQPSTSSPSEQGQEMSPYPQVRHL